MNTCSEAEEPERLLITRALSDLVLHGLTNNRAWLILGGFGAAYGQFAEDIEGYIASLGIDVGAFLSSQSVAAFCL